MVEIKGHTIKSEFKELTIAEYEKQVKILNDPRLDYIEKYCKIFAVLGLPEEVIDELDIDELVELVKTLTASQIDGTGMKREVEINGFTYVGYEGEQFKLKMGDMVQIEKIVKQHPDQYIARVCAVIMKRTDLTKNEHYENVHIEHKAKLLGDQLMCDFVGYLLYIQDKVVNKAKMMVDAAASE